MIPKGKLGDVIKEWLIIQWSNDTKGEIKRRNQRMTDNTMANKGNNKITELLTMAKWYQRGN
jgi:hypothetical protein